MKRRAVLKKIRTACKAAGIEFEAFERANHTGLKVGNVKTTIGRHNEIPEQFVEMLYKQLEPALGRRWWRR